MRSRLVAGAAVLASLVLAGPAGAVTPNNWGAVGSLSVGRSLAVSAVLPDGNVLVAGGTGTAPVASSEIFDPATDTWSAGPDMSNPRAGAVAVTLTNGDVFIAGGTGTGGAGGALNTADVYNPTLNTFTEVSNKMASDRYLPAAALLPGGDVLVVGGQDRSGNALTTAELYDPTTNAFLTGAGAPADMSTGRALPVAATLDNGEVLVAGGAGSNDAPLPSAEVYDPAANSWTPVSNAMSTPRLGAGIATLSDGRVLLVGGESVGPPVEATTATTDFYSPTTNSFTSGPPLATPRFLFGIDVLHDGRVLVAGGAATNNGTTTYLSNAEVFDPTAEEWSATGSLPQAAAEFATAVLPSGQVLATGGTASSSPGNAFTQTLLYTPATVPAAPTAVSASAGSGSAVVTFAPPAGDGGAPITGYQVTASTGQTATTPDARTFATVTGLNNGTAVTFTVRAVNAEGAGPASTPSNPVTPATANTTTGTTPDKPPALRLTGLATHLTLGKFIKGLRFTVKPTKPASLQITLLGTVNRATIATAFNLTLARRTLGMSAARRTVTLEPARKLVGDPLGAKVKLVIVAIDQAGSRSTTIRKITIRR